MPCQPTTPGALSAVGLERDPNQSKPTVAARALREFRRMLGMFFYLWIVFALFVANEQVILAQHQIDFRAQGFAIINALVLAKVMLVAESLHLGKRYEDRPLIYPIVHKALVFSLIFIGFHAVERIVVGMLHGRSLVESFPAMGGGGLVGILCVAAIMFLSLMPFFAFWEVGRVIGRKELWSLLLTRRAKSYTLVPAEIPVRAAPATGFDRPQ
jgi:hypothetical protein